MNWHPISRIYRHFYPWSKGDSFDQSLVPAKRWSKTPITILRLEAASFDKFKWAKSSVFTGFHGKMKNNKFIVVNDQGQRGLERHTSIKGRRKAQKLDFLIVDFVTTPKLQLEGKKDD